jgi:hypothetical protein
MKAIRTKYHGPTDTRGSRISASDEDGNRVSIPYPHELSGEAAHRAAADALCRKMNWSGELIGGALKDGYAFVWVPESFYHRCGKKTLAPDDLVRPCILPINHDSFCDAGR